MKDLPKLSFLLELLKNHMLAVTCIHTARFDYTCRFSSEPTTIDIDLFKHNIFHCHFEAIAAHQVWMLQEVFIFLPHNWIEKHGGGLVCVGCYGQREGLAPAGFLMTALQAS